ncbi:MAG TPA: hypothetical protein VFW95_01170 [Candidatus Limnocylindria bacterium]|nr:hypothetical protein [Candidatus Limnocylindria bacterium]
MRSRVAPIALVALILVGCADASASPRSRAPDPSLNPDLPADIAQAVVERQTFGLRADVEYVEDVHAADDSILHEIGILVTPQEAAELDRRFSAQDELGGLAAYGAEHADSFGGMYIDQAAGGDVVMLFTRDLDRHRIAVAALAPQGIRARVEEVTWTEAELTDLLSNLDFDALGPGAEMVSASVDTIRNVVTLEVKTNDPSFEGRLENQYGGALDVSVFPVPGPWRNAEAGDGWRLVAAGEAAATEAYTVRAATSDAEWTEMQAALGAGFVEPPVDFASDVAVSFGHGIGSGCREVRLDDIVIEDGVVYSVTSDPLAPRGCTSDLAGAAVFVVALERSALPRDGFTLRLSQNLPACEDCGFTQEIDVSLP